MKKVLKTDKRNVRKAAGPEANLWNWWLAGCVLSADFEGVCDCVNEFRSAKQGNGGLCRLTGKEGEIGGQTDREMK